MEVFYVVFALLFVIVFAVFTLAFMRLRLETKRADIEFLQMKLKTDVWQENRHALMMRRDERW